MKRENLMKNNTKLIIETWRRFIKEGPFMDNPDLESGEESLDVLKDEPSEGYFDDDYNEDGFNPDANSLDNPIDGEPPFDHAAPPKEDGIMADDDYDEIPYTQEDAMMTPEQRRIAFGERYGDDGADYLDDNPFGDDDGPY